VESDENDFLSALSTSFVYILEGMLKMSDGDAIAVLHMHDAMVCRHPSPHSVKLPGMCVLYWQWQSNKVNEMPTSTTYFILCRVGR